MNNDYRINALKRPKNSKGSIADYLQVQGQIETGFRMAERSKKNKEIILKYFNASEEDWNNWVWQMKHRISDVDTLINFINLSGQEIEELRKVSKLFRWALIPILFKPDRF